MSEQPRLDEARLREIEQRLRGINGVVVQDCRDLLAALRVERERAERLERELLPAVKAVLDNGVLVEGGVLIADTGAATDLQIVYAAVLAEQEKEPE